MNRVYHVLVVEDVVLLSVGPEAISFGNGKFLWENKLGLQASTHWYGRLELDPGFGSRSDGRVLRPTFTKGMKIIFVKGIESGIAIRTQQCTLSCKCSLGTCFTNVSVSVGRIFYFFHTCFTNFTD